MEKIKDAKPTPLWQREENPEPDCIEPSLALSILYTDTRLFVVHIKELWKKWWKLDKWLFFCDTLRRKHLHVSHPHVLSHFRIRITYVMSYMCPEDIVAFTDWTRGTTYFAPRVPTNLVGNNYTAWELVVNDTKKIKSWQNHKNLLFSFVRSSLVQLISF